MKITPDYIRNMLFGKLASQSKLSDIFKEVSALGTQVKPKGPGNTTKMPKPPKPKPPKPMKLPKIQPPVKTTLPDVFSS